MRIGLIIYGSLDTLSGGYLYDRQLVRHLQQQGDQVHILSLSWSRYGNHLLHNLDSQIMAELANLSLDVLLQDELNHPSLFWLNRRLRQQLGCPLISIVHHLRSSESRSPLLLPFYRRIERQYLRTIDGFIFNSRTTRSTVHALLREEKPHVIAYPAADHIPTRIDRALLEKRAHQPGPLRLIFVGNIIPRKGGHILLQGLARLPAGSWQLTMVGDQALDPAYAHRLKRLADKLQISGSIQWLDRVPDSDLGGLFAASQLLVVPSSYEGFGIVYLEGMNYGLPAIATTAGAAHEIISDGENGVLIAPHDAQALAGRIQALQNDRSLLLRQSLAALDHAQKWPTWDASMAQIRQFLHQVC